MRSAAILLLSFLSSTAIAGQCDVPGATNPDVTQENVQETICVRGWTKKVRPSLHVTTLLKRQLLPSGHSVREFELDHCIPLELGGHPYANENLWLQEWSGPCGAYAKDHTENFLRSLVCSGLLSLKEAQERVMNWCKTEAR